MSRITSHIVNATKRHSSNRVVVVVGNDVLHQSALSRSLTSARPPTDIHRPRRRYFGDASKCGSSQCASVSSPSTSSSEENIGRRVENLHGSSVVRSRLSGENLILPNEIITTFSPLRPSTFAAKMDQQQQQQRQSCSQPQSGYHQLAPLRASTPAETREDAMEVALGAIDAVTPNEMIVKAITVEDGKLLVRGNSYTLRRNVYVAAFGKAVLGMIRAVEDIVGDHIVRGVASVPFGIQETLLHNQLEHLIPTQDSKVEIFEGARYNLPDQDCVAATEKICEMTESLTHGDILLVLISGGGSALLTMPQPPISLEDVIIVTKALGAKGATITQLNMLRRHLSVVKGGRLAQKATPAQVVSLILSDVLDDPLEAIASGPTVPCLTTAQCCLDVLASFKLDKDDGDVKETHKKIVNFLEAKKSKDFAAESSARQKLGSRFRNAYEEKMGNFSHVQNVIVGNNTMAVEEAVGRAESLGYRTFSVTTSLDGIAKDRGVDLANMALYACSLMRRHGTNEANKKLVRLELDLVAKGLSKVTGLKLSVMLSRVAESASNSGGGLCLISAGETTVQLADKPGKGGRNQELALAAGISLHQMSHGNAELNSFDVTIVSIGTDGQDGPTDAAGALADVDLIRKSGFSLERAQQYLDENDSYNFFLNAADGAYHIKTGQTGTNVMDLQLIMIRPKGLSPVRGSDWARKEFDEAFE